MRRAVFHKIAIAGFTIAIGSFSIASNALAYGGGCFGHACGLGVMPAVEGHSRITRYPERSSIWRRFNSDRSRDEGRLGGYQFVGGLHHRYVSPGDRL
jgi:hypothetical protein